MDSACIGTKLAVGRTAEVFHFGPDRVLKLYREGCPEAVARTEYENTLCVHRLGLPVPQVFEVGASDGRHGIVMELVEGESLTAIVLRAPWKIKWAAGLLAELHARVHSHRTDQLPSLKICLGRRLAESTNLEEEAKSKALEILQTVPDGDTICHGDFHPDNVILTPNGVASIDWLDAASGSSVYDFAQTRLLLSIAMPEESGVSKRLAIRGVRAWFARIYDTEYRALVEVDRDELERWISIAAAVRLTEGVPGEQKTLMRILAHGLK